MDNNELASRIVYTLMALLIGGSIGVFYVRAGLRTWRRHRLIRDTQTAKATRLRPGLVEVKGRAATDMDLLVSPMTQQRCLHYRFVVTEMQSTHRRGKHKTKRVTVINDAQTLSCFVDDGSGRVAVDFAAAELHLKTDARASSGFLNSASDHLQQTLERRYGRSTTGMVFNKSMTFTETVVCPGDALYVLGTAVRRGDEFVVGGSNVGDDVFIVSDQREDKLASKLMLRAVREFAGAAVFVAGAVAVIVALNLL